jgi:hypothetical protein
MNESSKPLVKHFIYFINGFFCDVYRSQIFLIKLTLYRSFLQIFQLIDGPGIPFNNLDNPKYFLTKILFGAFCEFDHFLTNANVLSHCKFGPYGTHTTILIHFSISQERLN